jgi:hypothetical protein
VRAEQEQWRRLIAIEIFSQLVLSSHCILDNVAAGHFDALRGIDPPDPGTDLLSD